MMQPRVRARTVGICWHEAADRPGHRCWSVVRVGGESISTDRLSESAKGSAQTRTPLQQAIQSLVIALDRCRARPLRHPDCRPPAPGTWVAGRTISAVTLTRVIRLIAAQM